MIKQSYSNEKTNLTILNLEYDTFSCFHVNQFYYVTDSLLNRTNF